MATRTKTKQALMIEVEDLRARLERAEAALQDSRRGGSETPASQDPASQSFWRAGNSHSTLLAQVSNAVIAIDNNQRVTYLNAAAERQYGITAAEAVGRKLSDLYQYQWLQPDDEAVAFAALREQGMWRGENIHVRSDGKVLRVESSVNVLTSDAGDPIGMLAVIRDITQQHDAKEALQLQASLLDAVNQAVVATDMTGRITFWNRFAEHLYGWRAEEAMGRTVQDITPAQFTQNQAQEIMQVLQQGQEWSGEFTMQRKDGTIFQAFVTDAPIWDSQGKQVGIIGISTDFTERKTAEERMRQSEAHLRRVLDNLFAFVGVMLPDGTLIEANRAPLEAAGISLGEVIGRKFWDCYWWSYSPQVQAQLRDAVERANRGEVVRYDVPVRMAGDTRMWIDFQLSPLRNESGRITHLIPSAMDITARKLAEVQTMESKRQLEETNAFLEAVLSGAPVGLVIYDNDLRYLRINEALARINGQPAEAHIGRTSDAVLGPERAGIIDPILREVLETGETKSGLEMSGPDGHFLTDIYPIRTVGGSTLGVGVTVTDITERKQAEAALRESELRFRRLSDANIIGIVTASLDAVLTSNEEFLRMIGYSQEDVAAKRIDWQAMTPSEYVLSDQKGLAQLIEQGWSEPYEKQFIRKDGTRVSVLVGGALLTREPLTWICFVEDLSERKRIEAQLQTANYRFRIAEEAANGFSYAWNLETGIIERSAGLQHVLGYAPGEMAGTYEAWAGLVHPDDKPPLSCAQAIDNLKNSSQDTFGFEYRARHKNGQYRWLHERGMLLRSARGELQHVIGQAVDITERKEAEEALRLSEARYRDLNATLEARVAERTEELAQSREQLRELSAYVERMREEERTRIAREVHDELGGSLTVLKMSLARAARGHEADTELQSHFQDLRAQSDNIIKMVRRIASDLRPSILDDFGLAPAMEWQAQEWSQRTGIPCQLDTSLASDDLGLDAKRRTAIFRVFQESLTNIARHARATSVSATLMNDGEGVELVVKDNGQGIEPARLMGGKSLGLLGMRERIREVGGNFEIDSAPGQGTVICVRVPLKRD